MFYILVSLKTLFGTEVNLKPGMIKLFYRLKPLIPRTLQIGMRRARARRIFEQLAPPYLDGLPEEEEMFMPPDGYDSVVLLTHDVESARGLKNIERLREMEREFDAPSTWNFVLRKYGDTSAYIDRLRSEGCECGAHGLLHDGKLFRDRDTYRRRMEEIAAISERLGLKGFRSPALHRNREWMADLPFDWDSSFPSWDPFQPQPGGCRRYVPFKLNHRTWEFPVTMFQDFTLLQELNCRPPDVWLKQFDALFARKALVNLIIHPDYFCPDAEHLYRNMLDRMKASGRIAFLTPSLIGRGAEATWAE